MGISQNSCLPRDSCGDHFLRIPGHGIRGVLLQLGFSNMRSEELAFVNHVHEFNPRDDASGVVERLKAKHGL